MTGPALVLVVAAALLHTTWNALAKRSRDPQAFLCVSVGLGGVLLTPWALLTVAAEGFSPDATPFVAASIAVHALYFWALGRAYRQGDLSRVYPIARGLGVGLAPILAIPVLDERPSPLGAAGIALVVGGVLALRRPGRSAGPRPAAADAGTRWATLTGLAIATYSLVDKAGVARLHPVPYVTLLGAGSALLLAPVAARGGALRREWRAGRPAILAAAAMNLTAYLLVLFAFRLSKLGYVVAARELSIVFSTAIGSRWLGEGELGPRLGAAAVVLAGVVLVALAR